MQEIIPFLWFDGQAEEAANFYVSTFKNSKIGNITRYTQEVSEGSGQPAGSVLTVSFEINGREFVGLNGGPMFKFTEAVSFMVPCDSQEELDDYWAKLTDGGEVQMCGWLKDKFGLSWQIVPAGLDKMIHDADPEKSGRVMAQIMQMKKLDFEPLRQAYEGELVAPR